MSNDGKRHMRYNDSQPGSFENANGLLLVFIKTGAFPFIHRGFDSLIFCFINQASLYVNTFLPIIWE